LIASSLSSAQSPQSIELLSKQLSAIQRTFADSKIEQLLAGSNPKQIDALDAFLSGEFKVVALIGGNRSGKTIAIGGMCFARHLRDDAKKNTVYWCISPNAEKSVTGQQKELWETLPRWMFGDQSYDAKNGFGAQRPMIVLDKGGRNIIVRFKTSEQYAADPNSFESEKLAGVWFDESLPQSAYDALYARTIDLSGFILGSCIPNETWMHDEFMEAKPGSRIWCKKIAMMDNPHLPIAEIETAKSKWSEEEQQVRIYGNFRFLEGLVYKEFIKEYAPEGHLCKPFAIPKDWPRFRWLDWGNAHNTVCLWATVSPNETIYVYREYVAKQKTVKEHAHKILEFSRGERFPQQTLIDPACFNRNQANMASIADEFAKHGLPCRPAVRTNSVGEWALVQRVKARLEAKSVLGPLLQVFDTCEHLVWEFRHWKYKTNKDGKPLGSDAFEDKYNDALDALKYGIASAPQHKQRVMKPISTVDD